MIITNNNNNNNNNNNIDDNNDNKIDDNECFKWCLVRYLDLSDHHAARITKADKDFAKKLDFKDIKFLVKVRDIYKIEKKIHRHQCLWL